MDASLLTRLIKAIGSNNDENLDKLARLIIKDEKNKGHIKLAKTLDNLLKKNEVEKNTLEKTSENSLFELPRSQRNNQPLAAFVPFDPLRHHPIFSDEVEARFIRIEKEYAP